MCYIILEKMCLILSLYLIQGPSLVLPDFLVVGRGQAGHLLELPGEVLNTAVSQQVRDLADGKFIIYKQFFRFLDFLQDQVFLDGFSFYGRKEVTQVGVFICKFSV